MDGIIQLDLNFLTIPYTEFLAEHYLNVKNAAIEILRYKKLRK